ncbi:MAG: hypothetical protein K2X44_03095, partial [Magnetospirillum sp.]|nr:hypothetical protein [Magnetospirillum sp.]
LSAPGHGLPYYFRLSESRYHTMVVRSDVVVYHEITGGPFNRADTQFAPWAPSDRDSPEMIAAFAGDLERRLDAWS